MIHRVALLFSWAVRVLMIWLPDHPLFMRFRGFMYSFAMKLCGKNFQVSASVIIKNLPNLSVGNNTYLAPNVVINAIAPISIQDEVMVGFNSVLVSGNHTRSGNSFRYGPSKMAPIDIQSGAWVGANCTILPGAKVGRCSVLAANSALNASTPDFSVYGGVPARLIKTLD